jgi:hypothetical protein
MENNLLKNHTAVPHQQTFLKRQTLAWYHDKIIQKRKKYYTTSHFTIKAYFSSEVEYCLLFPQEPVLDPHIVLQPNKSNQNHLQTVSLQLTQPTFDR